MAMSKDSYIVKKTLRGTNIFKEEIVFCLLEACDSKMRKVLPHQDEIIW